jgi:hypothetical protein
MTGKVTVVLRSLRLDRGRVMEMNRNLRRDAGVSPLDANVLMTRGMTPYPSLFLDADLAGESVGGADEAWHQGERRGEHGDSS